MSVHLQRVPVRDREHVDAVPAAGVAFHRCAHGRFRELPRLVERELLAEPLLEDAVRDRRAAPRGHEVLRGDRAAHVARVHVRALMVHARDDELDVERVVALHRRVDDVRDQFRTLLDGHRVAATQGEEPPLAFARFTRYSASDIAPAIATAVVPSREKIFWTTLDPTKNPFEARLSAARTTPSLLRMPTVVVMLNLGPLCGRSGKLIRVPETKSHGWPGRSLETTGFQNLLGVEGPGSVLPRPKHPGDQQERAEDPRGDRHEEPQRVGVHSRRSPADRFRNRVDLDLVIAARRIPDFVAPPVVREDVIQDGSGTVL